MRKAFCCVAPSSESLSASPTTNSVCEAATMDSQFNVSPPSYSQLIEQFRSQVLINNNTSSLSAAITKALAVDGHKSQVVTDTTLPTKPGPGGKSHAGTTIRVEAYGQDEAPPQSTPLPIHPVAPVAPPPAPGLVMTDFKLGRLIGTGSFGRVTLARHRVSQAVVVIKSISKATIIQKGHVRHVLDEKSLLSRVSAHHHPFLVNLKGAFQDTTCLHLVMEFVPGGDFFAFLRDLPKKTGSKMPEVHARFYAAQLVLALEHLHSRGIVFRDLKPENVLMGGDGYLKVADFGFAKVVGRHGITRSFCGTPDYLAPEVIYGQGHGLPVDWWSMGCMIYEMLYGFPPFYSGQDHQMTYRRVGARMQGAPLHYPTHWTSMARDLIDGLLSCDPSQRYGIKGGVQAIKDHPWFQGIQWDLVATRRYAPPHRPTPPPVPQSPRSRAFIPQSQPSSTVASASPSPAASTTTSQRSVNNDRGRTTSPDMSGVPSHGPSTHTSTTSYASIHAANSSTTYATSRTSKGPAGLPPRPPRSSGGSSRSQGERSPHVTGRASEEDMELMAMAHAFDDFNALGPMHHEFVLTDEQQDFFKDF